MYNAMAQIGPKKNSSGDVSLRKEKVPLLQYISVGSNNMFWSNDFLTFVIMQVIILNI